MIQDSFSYMVPDSKLTSLPVTCNIFLIKDEDIFAFQNGTKIRKVYQNCEYEELQKQKIKQFREYCVEKFDVKKVGDHTILRYLYSFDFKYADALEKLKIYCDWYNNPKIQRMDRSVLEIINSGVCYTYGRDKELRPIIYLNVAKMDMQKYTLDDYLAAANAVITLVVEKIFIKGKVENYMFIIDTQGKGFGSLPLNTVKEMVLKFSFVYSMRMGKLLLINCNYLIKFMYSTVSMVLSDITKEKIKLLSTSEVENGKINEFIDINELEQKYGGFRQNLVQKWPPQIPGKEIRKKQQQLREYSFDEGQKEHDLESEYFSCANDSTMFYKLDENPISSEGCCSNNECNIY